MYLAFDTETTDLPRSHLSLSHPSQPHLIQFAGVLFDDAGSELDSLCTKVRPRPGALMSAHAFAAHGISLEEAFHCGMEVADVLNWFLAAAARSACIIGHNVQFDLQIMAIAAARVEDGRWSTPTDFYCTMAHAAPLVNLPPTPRMMAAGRYGPKPPTLGECVKHFFGEELAGAHDAVADVKACIRIFRFLTGKKIAA